MKQFVRLIGLIILFVLPSFAQKALEITTDSSLCEVINRTGYPWVWLLQGQRGPEVVLETVQIAKTSTAKCSFTTVGSGRFVTGEPITLLSPTKGNLMEVEAARIGAMTIDELRAFTLKQREMSSSDSLSTPEAREQMENVRVLANLRLEQRLDELQVRQNDPVRAEVNRQATSSYIQSADMQGLDQMRQQQNQQQIADTIETITAMAASYSMVDTQKREILAQQRDQLKSLVESAEKRKQDLRDAVHRIEVTANSRREYYQAVVLAFRANNSEMPPQGTIQVLSEAKKLRSGPSGAIENIEIQIDAPSELAVVFAEVKFNHGASHKTILRRVLGSNRWRGEFVWPVDAQSAQLSVQHPTRSKPVAVPGQVTLDREPIKLVADQAAKALDSIKKKYKETEARAAGMDGTRTMAIP